MTIITTKVTGPDKYPCSPEHVPQVAKTKVTTTIKTQSTVIEPEQCSVLCDKGKSVTEISCTQLQLFACMTSLWDNIILKLHSTYFLKTRILMLPQSQIGRGQLRLLKKAHILWSCFVFCPLTLPLQINISVFTIFKPFTSSCQDLL